MREAAGAIAKLGDVLSSPVRVEVLLRLVEGPVRSGTVAEELQLDATLVCHHLKVLRDAGLVERAEKREHVLTRMTHVARHNGFVTVALGGDPDEDGRVALVLRYPSRSSRASGSCEVKAPSDQRTRT